MKILTAAERKSHDSTWLALEHEGRLVKFLPKLNGITIVTTVDVFIGSCDKMSEESTFSKHNGLLRFWAILVGCIALGLTLSKFRPAELNELVFVSSLGFCCSVSSIHFGLCFIGGCLHSGKCFKISDFMFHVTSGIILAISSVLMLLVAAKRGTVMDYRFQDTKVVLIRTIAGVLGLQGSFIYFTLAYLTITDKQFIYCKRNPKTTKEEVENGNNATVENNSAAPATLEPPSSPYKIFMARMTWRRLLADEVFEARIVTVILGGISVGLTAESYQSGNEIEEFFFSMTIACLSLTLLSQLTYFVGLARLGESALLMIEVLLHSLSSLSLLLGGTLMLGSVVQSSSYSYQEDSVERTVAALIGVYNGIAYGFVATRLKRAYLRRMYGNDPYAIATADGASKTPQRDNGETEGNASNDSTKQGCAIA